MGAQRGHALGYPTANLRFGGKTPALRGIYATWVHGVGDTPRPSVSSFGTRPTVDGVDPLLDNLKDNGGPTMTHALKSGSPAVDAGNSAGCKDPRGIILTVDPVSYTHLTLPTIYSV